MSELAMSVLSWNLYLGADVGRVIGAKSSLVPSRMASLWQTAQRTNFAHRAKSIARIIRREDPDIVALQEVGRWSSAARRPLNAPATPEKTEFDFLRILLNELEALGAYYFVAVRSPGVDILLPTCDGPDIRIEDSVALLLRAGSALHAVEWEKPRAGRFSAKLRTTMEGDPFDIQRGWASIDLRLADDAVRIITTHLEYYSSAVQPMQVSEILNGPAAIPGPVILAGDFNCRPDSGTWEMLNNSGYTDVWLAAGKGQGYTSSHDEDLRNSESTLHERIDWILCRGKMDVLEAKCVGANPEDRASNEVWPSDHAGVFAKLRLPPGDVGTKRPKRRYSMNAPTEPLEIVKIVFDRFIKRDLSGVMDFVDPEGEWFFPGNPNILPWAGTFRGAGLMRFFIQCAESLDYLEYKAHTFYAQGQIVTVLSSEKCRVKKTGKVFDNQLASIVRVRNGKIVEYLEYADTAAMHAAFESD